MLIKAGHTSPQAGRPLGSRGLADQAVRPLKTSRSLDLTFHRKNVNGAISDEPSYNTNTLSDAA